MPTAGESSRGVAAPAVHAGREKLACRLLRSVQGIKPPPSLLLLFSFLLTRLSLCQSNPLTLTSNSYDAEYDEAPEDVSVVRVEKMKEEEETFAVVGF